MAVKVLKGKEVGGDIGSVCVCVCVCVHACTYVCMQGIMCSRSGPGSNCADWSVPLPYHWWLSWTSPFRWDCFFKVIGREASLAGYHLNRDTVKLEGWARRTFGGRAFQAQGSASPSPKAGLCVAWLRNSQELSVPEADGAQSKALTL